MINTYIQYFSFRHFLRNEKNTNNFDCKTFSNVFVKRIASFDTHCCYKNDILYKVQPVNVKHPALVFAFRCWLCGTSRTLFQFHQTMPTIQLTSCLSRRVRLLLCVMKRCITTESVFLFEWRGWNSKYVFAVRESIRLLRHIDWTVSAMSSVTDFKNFSYYKLHLFPIASPHFVMEDRGQSMHPD